MLEQIREFGKAVGARCRSVRPDAEGFCDLATEMMEQRRLHESVDVDGLVSEIATSPHLGRQMDLTLNFASPPVTLYEADDFFLDVYFWLSPRTGIHNHGFSGAFTVLRGVSLHSTYSFEVRESHGGDVLIGVLRRDRTELLRRGEVRSIRHGTAFIHQVAHLSRPSVSLVVRTRSSGPDPAIFAYLPPSIAAKSISTLQAHTTVRKLQLVRYLVGAGHPLADEIISNMVRSSPPHGGFWIALEFFSAVRDLRRVEVMLGRLGSGLPAWAGALQECLARETRLAENWDALHDEGERLLVTLTATVDDASTIMDIIRAYQPDRPMVESVMAWVRGLTEKKIVDFELNRTAQVVLEVYLSGGGEAEARRAIADRFRIADGPQLAAEVRTFTRALAGVPLVAPFLRVS